MIKETAERIDLIPFGDWHIGSRECQIDQIKSMIKWVQENKFARVILMGDLLDAGLRT